MKAAQYFALKNGKKAACPSSARDEYFSHRLYWEKSP